MNDIQYLEWIQKLCALSGICCGHLSRIKIITLVTTITLCIILSLIIHYSRSNHSFQMKTDLSHMGQDIETNQSSLNEKEKKNIVKEHSNSCSTSHKRPLDLKKKGIGNGTHQVFNYVDLKYFHQKIKTKLPEYEKIIKQEASKHGLDWALIAAVMYQESHFNPKARSYTGVRGLMQLTQRTARELGVKNRLDPVQSIQGGVKYLKKLWNRFEDVHGSDRILFTLASYNVGYGHVRDAQMLAQTQGLDKKTWASVEQCLPLLMKEKYYRKTKYGYARGTEPVKYVKRIITYYDILQKITHG